jgi:energy-coupling factor transporter ATP-binding protein EcfA2
MTTNEKQIEYALTHGQALVITGPQGCGKSTLARKIAEKHGTYIETDARQLETLRGLNDLMESEPRTVICDGFPKSEDAWPRLKTLITNDTMKLTRQYGATKTVKAPNFIFCSEHIDPLPLGGRDRRFFLIELGEAT